MSYRRRTSIRDTSSRAPGSRPFVLIRLGKLGKTQSATQALPVWRLAAALAAIGVVTLGTRSTARCSSPRRSGYAGPHGSGALGQLHSLHVQPCGELLANVVVLVPAPALRVGLTLVETLGVTEVWAYWRY